MKKDIAWNTLGSVFYSFCQWFITFLVVHIATYKEAGFLSLAMTTSSSFSAISLFSMRNFQVSDVRGEYNQNEYVGSRITTCALALVACAVVSFFKNSTYQALCIDAFMVIRVAEAFSDVLHGENQKFGRYDYIGKSFILRGILTVASFSLGLLFIKDLLITLIVMAGLNLLASLLFDWGKTSKLEEIRPVLCSEKVLNLLKVCLPIVVFAFLLSLENLIPKQVLEQLEGTEELGIYSTIATPTLVVQVFAAVAFNPFLPKFSTVFVNKEYDKFLVLLKKTYAALIGMAAVVTLGAMLLGRWGLSLLFGKGILDYYELFMPIVWVTILTAFIWILYAIVVAIRRIHWLLIGMAVDFAACYFLTKPCIEMYGKNGVSVVQLMVYAVYILFMIIVCEVAIRRDKKRVI